MDGSQSLPAVKSLSTAHRTLREVKKIRKKSKGKQHFKVRKESSYHKDFTLISGLLFGKPGRRIAAETPARAGPSRKSCWGRKMATVFNVRASAGRGSFSVSLISANPPAIKACITAKPAHGRANRELLLGLEDLLGCSVKLVSGAASRKKTLAADCAKEHLVRAIRHKEKQRRKSETNAQ